MSDNGYVRLNRLRTALSQVKTEVDSDIASAISESASTLTTLINQGDSSTLASAKGYADGLKLIIDSNITTGDTNSVTTANAYTDSKISSVNSTINNLSESIPEQINLALETYENSIDYADATDLSNHTSNTSNPHNVTLAQVGGAAAVHTHVVNDLTDKGTLATANHTHVTVDITDLSTNYAAKSHSHTSSDISDLGNYAAVSHTHTESDITDLGDYATNTNLNSYGVKSISFSSNTLTLTMKDDTTKTTTIQVGNTTLEIISATYKKYLNSIVFLMSDNSEITCNLDNLIKKILKIKPKPIERSWDSSDHFISIEGSGTELDPYLIYTPFQFGVIGRDSSFTLNKCYKLMNDLDFSVICGIDIEFDEENNTYTIVDTNQNVPFYNNGEGFWPIGYYGYYPVPSNSSQQLTWTEVTTLENFDRAPNSTGIRGSLSSNNYQKHLFTGKIDGNGKIIKGIRCAPRNTFAVGLFMLLGQAASIHNLILEDCIFVLPTVWHQWPNNEIRESYIGSLAGTISRAGISGSYLIDIHNVYSQSTIINDSTMASGNSYTGGLVGYNGDQNYIGFAFEECSFRGQIKYTNQSNIHITSGIICSKQANSNNQKITNCINTSSFEAFQSTGLSKAYGYEINLNCGVIISTSTSTLAQDHTVVALQTLANTSYSYFNNQIPRPYQSGTRVTSKSPEELKSQEFINYINNQINKEVFAYNDLNINDGWPLLIDEYNNLITKDISNLPLVLLDQNDNTLYNSGYTLDDLNSFTTELNNTINSTHNIQMQLNDARMYGFFPAWEYEHEYSVGDCIRIPCCKSTQYLECIVGGVSGSCPEWPTGQTKRYYTIENGQVVYHERSIDYKLDEFTSVYNGQCIVDGTCVWLAQDIRDGRPVGAIDLNIWRLRYKNPLTIWYGLSLGDSNIFYSCNADKKNIMSTSEYLKYVRLIKIIISSAIMSVDMDSLRLFDLMAAMGSGNSKYLQHIAGAALVLDWCFRPFDYLKSENLNNIDERVFNNIIMYNNNLLLDNYNSTFGVSLTKSQIITEACACKNKIYNNTLEDDKMYLQNNSIGNRYIRFGFFGEFLNAGLPNLSGALGYIHSHGTPSNLTTSTNLLKWAGGSNRSNSNYQYTTASGSTQYSNINFNANRGNSIYGNSTTVQPNTVTAMYCIKW